MGRNMPLTKRAAGVSPVLVLADTLGVAFFCSCSDGSDGFRVGDGLLLIIGSQARLSQAACSEFLFIITLPGDTTSQHMAVLAQWATGGGISTDLKLLCSYVPYTTMRHFARGSRRSPNYFTHSLQFTYPGFG